MTTPESRTVEPASVEERLAAALLDVAWNSYRIKPGSEIEHALAILAAAKEHGLAVVDHAATLRLVDEVVDHHAGVAAKEHGLVIGEGELDRERQRLWKAVSKLLERRDVHTPPSDYDRGIYAALALIEEERRR